MLILIIIIFFFNPILDFSHITYYFQILDVFGTGCLAENTNSIVYSTPPSFIIVYYLMDNLHLNILKYQIHIIYLNDWMNIAFQFFVSYFKDVHIRDDKSTIVGLGDTYESYQWYNSTISVIIYHDRLITIRKKGKKKLVIAHVPRITACDTLL